MTKVMRIGKNEFKWIESFKEKIEMEKDVELTNAQVLRILINKLKKGGLLL